MNDDPEFFATIHAVSSEISARNFIFTNSIKIHICDVRNSQLGDDLHISVNARVIS